MKVLCINSKGFLNQMPPVIEGEKYTVIDDTVVAGDGKTYYEFAEIPGYYYWQPRFIPISDISETEMERNYNFKTEEV